MLSWDVTNPQRIMTEIVQTICFPFNISLLTYYEKKINDVKWSYHG